MSLLRSESVIGEYDLDLCFNHMLSTFVDGKGSDERLIINHIEVVFFSKNNDEKHFPILISGCSKLL